KPTYQAQEAAFRRVLKEAKAKNPKAIRRMAMWSRAKPAASVLKSAMRDDDASVRGAAIDAYLLLDEEDARRRVGDIVTAAETAVRTGRHGDAYALYGTMAQVFYDARIWKPGRAGVKKVTQAAREEYDRIFSEPAEKQDALLRALKRRIKGMPIADELK
ncbi:MAG: hypothetical protein ACYS0E_22600, partial [Planctomycetota bacterium]